MPKEIVRPIPEKSTGQFDAAAPDIMAVLKAQGTVRFSPRPAIGALLHPSRNYGRYE